MTLFQFDQKYFNQHKFVAGIDEAGRGAWAGPVVAAAVIVSKNHIIPEINDSKKLTPKKRDELFEKIISSCVSYSVGLMDSDEIDEINILEATKKAMLLAVGQLKEKPDLLLIDGNIKLETDIQQEAVIDGDAKSYSIAAASIVAKVTRDRMMMSLSRVFPEYHFEKHKGYGTKAHQEALQQYGCLTIHRKSYRPIAQFEKKSAH